MHKTCENCNYWTQDSSCSGVCCRIQIDSRDKHMQVMRKSHLNKYDVSLRTWDNFGCNEWAEKEGPFTVHPYNDSKMATLAFEGERGLVSVSTGFARAAARWLNEIWEKRCSQ